MKRTDYNPYDIIRNDDKQQFLHSEDELNVETAHINMRENILFPNKKFDIKIISHDHTPPHFHIIYDGWDITYEIETGRELEIIARGSLNSVYKYISINVNKWLDSRCALLPQITNRENATAQWTQIHNDIYNISNVK